MTNTSYSYCVNLDDFRQTSWVDGFSIHPDTLEEGQVMVHIDKLALTSNSISYVIAGKSGLLRFLDLFPALEGLGHIPCWGYGDVIYSKNAEVAEGERLYGFFPIASHVVLTPGKIKEKVFTDVRPGREVVAPFYSEYNFARKEPGYAPQFEEIVSLFRPLFGTSFLLDSFCDDHDFFNADRIIISSASAKTSIGFAHLLRKNRADRIRSIGLTSKRNLAFVKGLNIYDDVLTYDDIDQLEQGGRAIFFDVAGNQDVLRQVHHQLGESIVYSGQVGQTHWDANEEQSKLSQLPGARPVFWSGPDQVMKLRERHGVSGMVRQIGAEMIQFLPAAFGWIKFVQASGPGEVDQQIKMMLDGKISAKDGIILSP